MSLTREKRKWLRFEDSYVTLKLGLQLEGYNNRNGLEKGKRQFDNSKFFSKECFDNLLAVGSDIETLALQLFEGVSTNRSIEEACQAELRRSSHTIES